MKAKKIILLIIACFVTSLISISSISAGIKEIQHNKTVKIKLKTMQCNMCEKTITEAINSVSGVVKTTVSYKKKSATVIYNADVTSKEAIEKAITSAGYDANNKSADKDAYEKLHSCCKKP